MEDDTGLEQGNPVRTSQGSRQGERMVWAQRRAVEVSSINWIYWKLSLQCFPMGDWLGRGD